MKATPFTLATPGDRYHARVAAAESPTVLQEPAKRPPRRAHVIMYCDLLCAVCVCCVHSGIESSSSSAAAVVLLYLVGASDVDVQ